MCVLGQKFKLTIQVTTVLLTTISWSQTESKYDMSRVLLAQQLQLQCPPTIK